MQAAPNRHLRHACRYRTQLCNDGPMCSRPVCFFAHTASELRETELAAAGPAASPKAAARAAAAAAAAGAPAPSLPPAVSLDKPGSGSSTPRNPLDCRAAWGQSPPESEVSLSPAGSFCLDGAGGSCGWPAGLRGAALPANNSLPLPRAAPPPAALPPARSAPAPDRPLPPSALRLQVRA